jgi:hypothetical protein
MLFFKKAIVVEEIAAAPVQPTAPSHLAAANSIRDAGRLLGRLLSSVKSRANAAEDAAASAFSRDLLAPSIGSGAPRDAASSIVPPAVATAAAEAKVAAARLLDNLLSSFPGGRANAGEDAAASARSRDLAASVGSRAPDVDETVRVVAIVAEYKIFLLSFVVLALFAILFVRHLRGKIEQEMKDARAAKATENVEDEGSTATLSGSSISDCSLYGDDDGGVAAAPSSRISASGSDLDGTSTQDALCYKDDGDGDDYDKIEQETKDMQVVKATMNEDEGLTASLSSSSVSGGSLNGDDDGGNNAVPSSRIIASINDLDVTSPQDASCHEDGGDDDEAEEDNFVSTPTMTSSYEEFLRFVAHDVASVCEGTKMRRVVSAPALHDDAAAAVLDDITSSGFPSRPHETPSKILRKKESLKRTLTMMRNSDFLSPLRSSSMKPSFK